MVTPFVTFERIQPPVQPEQVCLCQDITAAGTPEKPHFAAKPGIQAGQPAYQKQVFLGF
ncbi:hypothetical protein ACH8KY_004308 [Salmonella enterica subsp. enterica serovar Braenderup]